MELIDNYIRREGEVIHDHTEVKRLLDLVRTCCKGQDKPILDVCQRFNQETADGRRMQPYSDLLGKSIRSMIEVKEEKDLDSLFSDGKTTALTDCLVPHLSGVLYHQLKEEKRWDKYYTEQPRLRTRQEQKYKRLKRDSVS